MTKLFQQQPYAYACAATVQAGSLCAGASRGGLRGPGSANRGSRQAASSSTFDVLYQFCQFVLFKLF
jgi:hypothetical protein